MYKQVLDFNGKDLVHGTMPWAAGDRFAVILFERWWDHALAPSDLCVEDLAPEKTGCHAQCVGSTSMDLIKSRFHWQLPER